MAHNTLILNDQNGVKITGATAFGNLVMGNFIGTDAEGAELANFLDGILIDDGAYSNTIGDDVDPTDGNTIRFNIGDGINILTGTRNAIVGNSIESQLGDGIAITNSYFGSYASANNHVIDNIVSDNLGVGIHLTNAGCNVLADNTIENNVGDGVRVDDDGSDNLIGGANLIHANSGNGITIESGVHNGISGNSIYANGGLGIDLGDDGVTPNDPLDPDLGANEFQNFPVITGSYIDENGDLHVQGYLMSKPSSYYTLQFYWNHEADPSGYGEGEIFQGSGPAGTDEHGYAYFTGVVLPTGENGYLTITATDAWGNTSEFSQAFCVEIPLP